MVGSPDFIGDLKVVKGKTDTGFVAPMAAGVVATFEHDQAGIARYRDMYRSRLSLFSGLLTRHGMRLALEPAAGFYTLWLIPTRAFGRRVESAEHFNFMMIEATGVVGVHFPGYMRYAVCADVAAVATEIDAAFEQARSLIELQPRACAPLYDSLLLSTCVPFSPPQAYRVRPVGAAVPCLEVTTQGAQPLPICVWHGPSTGPAQSPQPISTQ